MDDTQVPTTLDRPFLFDAAIFIIIVPFSLNLQKPLFFLDCSSNRYLLIT